MKGKFLEQMGCLLGFAVLIGVGVLIWYLYNEYAVANCEVYVDNGSKESYRVNIDGQYVLTVDPGEFGKAVTHSGDRHIRIFRGETTIYDEVKQLKRTKDGKTGRYILNPDETHHYWFIEVEYGPNTGLDLSPYQKKLGPAPVVTLDEEYQRVANLVKIAPDSKWVSGEFDLILKTPPKKLPAERSYDRKNLNCVLRLDEEDFELLQEAKTKKNVTVKDLDELKERVRNVFKSTGLPVK